MRGEKMKTKNQKTRKITKIFLVLAGLLVVTLLQTKPVHADVLDPATCTYDVGTNERICDLYATAGTITLPGLVDPVPIWGYTMDPLGSATLPGPAIIANEGETLVINLHNQLTETTGLLLQGQSIQPDLVGVAPDEMGTYTLDTLSAGTYLYEAALLPNTQHQVALGMFGPLIVRPQSEPLQAYDLNSAFTDEALVILSEIDPDLNFSVEPASFDMRDYAPEFFLINGKAYPDTDEILTDWGNMLLLRIVNAGMIDHTMGLLGLDQSVIATDGYPYLYPRQVVTWTIAPGQTTDTLVALPLLADAPAGGGAYLLHDSSLMLHNSAGGGFGGMMTYIKPTTATEPLPEVGPSPVSVSLDPSQTNGTTDVTLTAIIPGATSAEFFIDAIGVDGAGMGMTDNGSGQFVATVPAADFGTWMSGDYTFFAHGNDGSLWGDYNFAVLHLDKQGPMTKIDSISPNPSDGSLAVNIRATGDDRMTGNNEITAGSYWIDSGPHMSMTIDTVGSVSSMSATIPAIDMEALSEGEHILSVNSTDSWGNMGMAATASLNVDRTGPIVTSVSVTPGVLSELSTVRLNTTMTDGGSGSPAVNSNIQKAEGFIDTIGAPGTGFPLIPRDGLFDEQTEEAYGDISFATILSLADGVHTLFVHGQDSSGNWGATSSVTFLIQPQILFGDGFESGDFANWGPQIIPATDKLFVTPDAAFNSSNGMQAVIDGGVVDYITDLSPVTPDSYLANFYFNPNGVMPDNADTEGVTIFSGVDVTNTELFKVQFRRQTGDILQVRLSVIHGGGTANTSWFTISNDWHQIQIIWNSGDAAYADLSIDGEFAETLSGLNTSGLSLDAVRLGPSSGSIGAAGTGSMYFDEFDSYLDILIADAVPLEFYYYLPLITMSTSP
jgi:FtsP/CotA-like multicopper oxidase with cupredoxin domain